MADFDNCDLHMDPADSDALDSLARQVTRWIGGRAVEVGSFVGEQSLLLAKRFGAVFCIDPWQAHPYDGDDKACQILMERGGDHVFHIFRKNCSHLLYRNIFPLKGGSIEYASGWPMPMDLVFIDANHSYEAVKADIQAWRPQITGGGIICGHDYTDSWPGVKKAVDELLPGATITGKTIWSHICR